MNQRTKADLERELLAKAQREERSPWKPSYTPWTTKEIERLRRLLHTGITYKEIGEYLGRPRNSISGAVKRLRDRGEL